MVIPLGVGSPVSLPLIKGRGSEKRGTSLLSFNFLPWGSHSHLTLWHPAQPIKIITNKKHKKTLFARQSGVIFRPHYTLLHALLRQAFG